MTEPKQYNVFVETGMSIVPSKKTIGANQFAQAVKPGLSVPHWLLV